MQFSLGQGRSRNPTMQSRRYVPVDIILQILPKLPVKSLLRFTSVSKTWKAFIESSSFISTYNHLSINNTRSCNSHLMYVAVPRGKKDRYCNLMAETYDHGGPAQIPLPQSWSGARIRNSSEGLICLEEISNLYIWNPFTRTMKRVPKDQIQRTYDMDECLGFGFAPQSRDHRVVKLMYKENCITEVEMYSLASDSWRRVQPPSRLKVSLETEGFDPDSDSGAMILDSNHSMISFKGSIYWLVDQDSNYIDTILRFDLEEENFEMIKLGETTIGCFEYGFMVVDGFLVLLEFMVIDEGSLILLKGYINKESESGSSSWVATNSVKLPVGTEHKLGSGLSAFSNNILVTDLEGRLFAYEGYCDGKDLSLKLKYLGVYDELYDFTLIPIKETLFLFNEIKCCKDCMSGRVRH